MKRLAAVVITLWGCSSDETSPTRGTSDASTSQANPLFVSKAYPATTVCQGCHVTGRAGAPIWFGADAEKSYPIFKSNGFDQGDAIFYTHGVHTGPALTAAQVAALNEWISSEGGKLAVVVDAGQ